MKSLPLHRWDVTPAEAREIQLQLRSRLELGDRLPLLRWVAGADVAFDLGRGRPFSTRSRRSSLAGHGRAIAGVIVYSFPELVEVERATAERPLTFPYVPGLLSFREAPALLAAFEHLRQAPDLIFVDGHGYAHPRRFGIACHLGVLLDRPTVGCAKSRLIGTHAKPPERAGHWTPLLDPADSRDGTTETIGAVLRTREAVRPIYVSQGHCVSFERAIELVRAVCDGYRIPRPTREADQFVEAVKRGDWPPRHGRGLTKRRRDMGKNFAKIC